MLRKRSGHDAGCEVSLPDARPAEHQSPKEEPGNRGCIASANVLSHERLSEAELGWWRGGRGTYGRELAM